MHLSCGRALMIVNRVRIQYLSRKNILTTLLSLYSLGAFIEPALVATPKNVEAPMIDCPFPLSATAGHGLLPAISPTALPADQALAQRRGWLRNGAAPGDFLAAPRCGACTRAGGSCCQPAMKNGRCRLHGGLSTGPRTPAGRARCAAARRKHGGYSAAIRALLAEARARLCRSRGLRVGLTGNQAGVGASGARPPAGAAAGQGVHRQNPSRTSKGERRSALQHRMSGKTTRTAGHGLLRSDSKPAVCAPTPTAPTTPPSPRASRQLAGTALTAGHGLLPSFSASALAAAHPVHRPARRQGLVQRCLMGSSALGLGLTVAPPVTAGHGVLQSFSVAPPQGLARSAGRASG